MAKLEVEGEELVLHLDRLEKLEGLHGDLRVPLDAVTGVEVLDDAHAAADVIGIKVGTRLPGTVEVGTVHASSEVLFVAVHRTTPRGVRVRLRDAPHDAWVVGCAEPDAVAAMVIARRRPR
jgi:hypothetical protein